MNSSRKRVEMSMNTKSSVEPAESYLDVLDEREKYWIDFYNGVEYGYNMKL